MTVVALKDVCRITNGGTPKSGVESLWHGGVAWLTPAEMGKRLTPYIGQTARTISQEGLANSSAKLVPPSSVILSTRAPIGHLAINETPMAFNQGCRGLTPGDKLETKYLYYFLYFSRDTLDGLGTGTTFKELSSSNLANFPIPLPPLDEQRRIVAVLDKAFAGIASATANAQKNLTNARALFEAGLENTFSGEENGWETKLFSELCTIKHGFAFKSEFFGTDGDYVLLTPGNFYETGGYRDRGGKQKFYTGEVPPDFILDEGDLLVAMTEQADGLLGSPIIVPSGATFLHNQRLGLVEPKPGVAWCAEFFFHAFNIKAVRLTLRRTGTGAKVRHTSPTKIGDVEIALPITEVQQRQVAAKLTALEFHANELADVENRKLSALTELKQSLLHKAFTGELT